MRKLSCRSLRTRLAGHSFTVSLRQLESVAMLDRYALRAGTLLMLPAALVAGNLSGQTVSRGPDASARRSVPSASAMQVTEPLSIDGKLNEAAWQLAAPLDGFRQREPQEGEPVSERTEVRVLYDADALYIGAWLFDRQAAAIVLGETRRDAEL